MEDDGMGSSPRDALPSEFVPRPVALPASRAFELAIEGVQDELTTHALADADACMGFFPALEGRAGILSALPKSRALARRFPVLRAQGQSFEFNFVRLSLKRQFGEGSFHLDTDAATALTGDLATLGDRLVWRLLLNLDCRVPRRLRFLDVNSAAVPLVGEGGYVSCPDPEAQRIRELVISARGVGRVYGLVLCASRVLHSGRDEDDGHFVAGYGRQTSASPAPSGALRSVSFATERKQPPRRTEPGRRH